MTTSCPPRFATRRTPDRPTLGPAVGTVAELLGKPLMAWQQHVADIVLEIDPETGRLAYSEFILCVPRQSGKSTLILAKAVHRASASGFFGTRQRVVYTAQTRAKAREKWEEDYAADLEHSRKFGPKVLVHKGNGNEHIRFPNGSRFGIEANTEKAGHGGTLDEAYIDEAFAQVDNRLEQAFGPAMITRRNKQLGVISTAGWSDAAPYYLPKILMGRKLVEDDVRSGVAYFEWSADDDADPADVETWLSCMPALHRPDCTSLCREHTVEIEAVQAEYSKAVRSGKLADFRRAYLNQWVPKPREADECAIQGWAFAADSSIGLPKPSAIGLAADRDRTWGSIGAAVRLDDDRILMGPVDRRPGIDWLFSETVRICKKHACAVVVDKIGPASDFVAPLRDAGVHVIEVGLNEAVLACSTVVDGVKDRTVIHPNDEDLNAAVDAARWRWVGDRRLFGRKHSTADISLLEAATLAVHGVDLAYDVMESFI